MIIPIDIVGGTNPGRYSIISSETTYNMITSDNASIPYSGYILRHTIQNEYSARGFYVSELGNFMVTVMGDQVYKITVADVSEGDLLVEQVATLATTDGDVQIDENGNSEIGFVDGLNLYAWNYLSGDFEIVDVQGITPNSITVTLGFTVISALNSNTFYYSNVNQMIDKVAPLSIPAFPLENAGEIGADKIVTVHSFKDYCFVLGSNQTKIWTDRGLATNPLQLDPTVVIQYGCLNKSSVASGFGILAWVAVSADSNATIVASTGGEPVDISTPGIDTLLSKLTNPNDCSSFIFQEDGSIFFQITFKTDNLTLTYDFSAKQFINVSDPNLNSHIAKKIVRFDNTYYFVSYSDNSIYEMGSKFTDYNGEVIPRIRITKSYRNSDNSLMRFNYLNIVCEQGTNIDPMYVDLSISKDGGLSFGNPIRRKLQRLGRYNGLVRYTNLGAGRQWVFQFRYYGTGTIVILSAEASTV